VFGQTFAGSVFDEERAYQIHFLQFFELGPMGIRRAEGTGVVEMLIDPILNVVKFSEIDDKAIIVYFVGCESEFDFPIVTVNERTVTRMVRLSMPEWDVAVNLRAGKHGIEGVR
jgi:hypothetical protein